MKCSLRCNLHMCIHDMYVRFKDSTIHKQHGFGYKCIQEKSRDLDCVFSNGYKHMIFAYPIQFAHVSIHFVIEQSNSVVIHFSFINLLYYITRDNKLLKWVAPAVELFLEQDSLPESNALQQLSLISYNLLHPCLHHAYNLCSSIHHKWFSYANGVSQ